MANVINKQNLIDQINALTVDGEFSQEDVSYLMNYIIANGDMSGSARDLIQVRRGNFEDLPTLAQGELAVTLDTEEMYFGGINGNVSVSAKLLADGISGLINVGNIGNGVTDVTVKIQLAMTACGVANVPLFLPSGVFMVGDLAIPNGLKMFGNGQSKTIIKRKAGHVTSQYAMLKALNGSNYEIDGIGFDGNKANVSNNAHNLLFSGCSNVNISNCRSFNSYRSGLFIESSTNITAKTRDTIKNCMFDNNLEIGMYVNGLKQALVDGCKFFSNAGSGFHTLGSNNIDIHVVNCESAFNGDHGIAFTGHNNNDSTQNDCYTCSVSNCNAHNNVGWGITFQCTGGIVTGNIIKYNGTTTNHAGLLLNGYNSTVTNNYIEGNYYYGIDMGDWINGVFSGNSIVANGNAIDGGIGLNAESCNGVGIYSNFFWNNGNDAGGYQMSLHGLGGGAPTTPFRGLNNNVSVCNNTVVGGNANQNGLYVDTSNYESLVTGNQFISFSSAARALQYSVISNPKCKNNICNFFINPIIASASSIVIPDDGDLIFVSGTTTLTEILTTSASLFKQKVSRIDVINQGSGYTSPPTVSITGGGGTGATAHAYVELATGKIISVMVDTGGTGYTSSPTISITGGGGTGGTGASYTECNNYAGRTITIKFQGTITINNTGNINLVGGTFAANANSTLVLIGEYGKWTEISRSTTA